MMEERRRAPRVEVQAQLAVSVLEPRGAGSIGGINISEGGVCLRLQEALEVRSLVRLQVARGIRAAGARLGKDRRPVECTGRVAWVIQRLDLRDAPPFLFDVGIEFVDPPPLLRQLLSRALLSRADGGLAALKDLSRDEVARTSAQRRMSASNPRKGRELPSALIRGRRYVAKVDDEPGAAARWHLVVFVDEMPCFSGRYSTERATLEAWTQFKRSRMKRSGASG